MAAERWASASPVVGLNPVSLARAARPAGAVMDNCLGPIGRPFGSESWVLEVESEPVAVPVGAGISRAHRLG